MVCTCTCRSGKRESKEILLQIYRAIPAKRSNSIVHCTIYVTMHAVFTYQLHNRDKGDEVEHGTKTNKVAQVSISTAAPAILHLRIQNHWVHMRKQQYWVAYCMCSRYHLYHTIFLYILWKYTAVKVVLSNSKAQIGMEFAETLNKCPIWAQSFLYLFNVVGN